ncbi:hypothetical protein [Geminocystis herdmanii]|uniref:hypothetical protein n=1 Tax=Geminocystis herdmanii TaxID=669359 RepID=UPI00036E19DD|nr:hypothetical protein [Geminocystis herdmanii]
MIVSSDIISSIAHDLSRSQEAKRAKKLIFYVSQRYWESDFAIVNSYSFETLLVSLYENNPTLDDLKALLYQAVNTLNRKEVYVKIAKYVFQRMSPLYNEEEHSSHQEENNQSNEFESSLLDRIAENIEYHEESPRIKKLIFAACKQYWENDINVIEMYDIKELLLELYQLYPNPKRLKKALENIVSTINRQNFYSFIADTIVGELTYLYKHETVEVTTDNGNEEEETQLIKAKNKNIESPPVTINQETNTETSEESSDDSDLDLSGSMIAGDVPEGQVIPWLKLDNLFDLKHEIMQYTNPLRAKIMLFYAMYQIDISEQHWSIVRTCSLDDLLIRMFQQYGKDIKTIESHLMSVANSSIEGLEPDDNAQTVSAIVESVKHFYKRA